jgi:Holliday junction DNA helicase RuvA
MILAEAETALIALGYKPVEASKSLAKLDFSEIDSSEAAIRAALKTMLKR